MSGVFAVESKRLTKQVKGLLNRLAEANLQASVGQAAELLHTEGRRPVIQALTDELLQVGNDLLQALKSACNFPLHAMHISCLLNHYLSSWPAYL